jgi:hypothetical protein
MGSGDVTSEMRPSLLALGSIGMRIMVYCYWYG